MGWMGAEIPGRIQLVIKAIFTQRLMLHHAVPGHDCCLSFVLALSSACFEALMSGNLYYYWARSISCILWVVNMRPLETPYIPGVTH